MRLTDRVEQVVVAAIEAYAGLAGCEVDHQVQIIHQQTRPGAPPTPLLWISLSVQSLALGEWLFHDPIISAGLHPYPEQLTETIQQALANLAAARAEQAETFTPTFRDASQLAGLAVPRVGPMGPARYPLTTGP